MVYLRCNQRTQWRIDVDDALMRREKSSVWSTEETFLGIRGLQALASITNSHAAGKMYLEKTI